MSELQIAQLVIPSVLAYLIIGGGVFAYWHRFLVQRCRKCSKTTTESILNVCYSWHPGPAIALALVWPLMAPALIGYGIVEYMTTKESRAAQRVEREELAHKRQMAELDKQAEIQHKANEAARDNMKFLVENGIQVPGLADIVARAVANSIEKGEAA